LNKKDTTVFMISHRQTINSTLVRKMVASWQVTFVTLSMADGLTIYAVCMPPLRLNYERQLLRNMPPLT